MKKHLLIILCLILYVAQAQAAIVISAPKAGDKITMNFPFEIKWVPPAVPGKVKIRLMQNNMGLGAITLATENDGSFSWNINQLTNGKLVTIGEKFRIKIISLNDGNVTGLSGEFSIRRLIIQKKPPLIAKKFPILKLLPDLFVTSVTVSKYNPSIKTTFTVNVKNTGGATSGAANISVWLYKLLPNGGQPPTANEYWEGTVPSGGGSISYMAIVPWVHDKYEFMTEGNWRVKVKLNPQKSIKERDYGNNEFTYNFTLPN